MARYLSEHKLDYLNEHGYVWLHTSEFRYKTTYISIEGNIAAGKSTFLEQHLSALTRLTVVPEPINRWRNYNNKNLLDLAYKHPVQYTYEFQNCIHQTFTDAINAVGKNKCVITERSAHAASHVFTPLMYERNYISTAQFVELFLRKPPRPLGACVYLYTTPQCAFDRVQLRQRDEEQQLSLDYLTRLHELHNKWLLESSPGFPVLLLDGSRAGNDNAYVLATKSIDLLLDNIYEFVADEASIDLENDF